MTQKELIKAEIERLMDCTMDSQGNFYSQAAEGEYHSLCHLENFIKSLPEEPVSKELEEAVLDWVDKHCFDCDSVGENRAKSAFKDGAQWHKEQMMEKALPAVVSQVPLINEIIFRNPPSKSEYEYNLPHEMSRLGLSKGDKVKLIVIKDE